MMQVVTSALLTLSGVVQTLTTIVLFARLNILHSVLQILAGVWAIFAGILCTASSWKLRRNYSSMQILGIRVSVFFNFILEGMAVIILLMDEAGISLPFKYYFSRFTLPSWVQTSLLRFSKGPVMLTSAGSIALCMGILIFVSTLSCFQNEEYSVDDVVALSARWIYKGSRDTFFRTPNLVSSLSHQKKWKLNRPHTKRHKGLENMPDCEPTKTFALRSKSGFWKYSSKKNESKLSPVCRIASFRSLIKDDRGNRNTYIRFHEDDYDIPLDRPLGAREEDSSHGCPSVTSIKNTSLRRTPIRVSSPTPPRVQ